MRNICEPYLEECRAAIHSASIAAAAAAGSNADMPLSDSAVITPIQVTMVSRLGEIFGLTLTEAAAQGALAAGIAAHLGRRVSAFLTGIVPGLETLICAASAAGMTEVVGWSVAEEFARQSEVQEMEDMYSSGLGLFLPPGD